LISQSIVWDLERRGPAALRRKILASRHVGERLAAELDADERARLRKAVASWHGGSRGQMTARTMLLRQLDRIEASEAKLDRVCDRMDSLRSLLP
jgi:hypothetical protein